MTNKEFDDSYRNNKIRLIAGVDEAGRGPLFGPVVVAGVVLDENFNSELIKDSKKMTERKKKEAYDYILKNAISYYISVVSSKEIDKLNILGATKKGMKEVLANLDYDLALIDAVYLNLKDTVSLIKGDDKSLAIAAASVLAKVTRDNIIIEMAKAFPEFTLEKHKGYPTKKHFEELKEFGATKYHRRSFKPVMAEVERGNIY